MSPLKREPFTRQTLCPVAARKVILTGEQIVCDGAVLGLSARLKCSHHLSCHASLEALVDDYACVITRLRARS